MKNNKVKHVIWLVSGLLGLLVVALVAPSDASALNTVNAGSSANVVFVGLADPPSGASTNNATSGSMGSGYQNWACVRGTSLGSSAEWYYLGNGFTGIADNTNIEGDGGNDNIEVIRSARWLQSGDSCRGDTRWSPPTQGASNFWIDIYGEDGQDTLNGGTNNSYPYGGDTLDYVHLWDPSGYAYGQGSGDFVLTHTTDEHLYGGAGDDCVDGSSSFDYGDGGTGTDTWDGPSCPTGASGGNFQNRVTFGSCSSGAFSTGPC